MRARGARKMVKAKTMLSEEIELADFLGRHGMEAIETDLGEFIVQIDHDHPSHIVRPIIHKNRREIAQSFEREGLGAYDDDPQTITRRARQFLRQKYLEADVGLTGANFISAESGRIVLVTNEGNSRFCLAATKCHIALVGIEKIVPRDRDLALLLNLLGRSATAQELTVYTEFISGPRAAAQPEEGAPAGGTPPMAAWALLASQPLAWRTALAASRLMNRLPAGLLPIPALRAWEEKRTLPEWRGGKFREWMQQRRGNAGSAKK
jgi:L-lactate utilization protein LutB